MIGSLQTPVDVGLNSLALRPPRRAPDRLAARRANDTRWIGTEGNDENEGAFPALFPSLRSVICAAQIQDGAGNPRSFAHSI